MASPRSSISRSGQTGNTRRNLQPRLNRWSGLTAGAPWFAVVLCLVCCAGLASRPGGRWWSSTTAAMGIASRPLYDSAPSMIRWWGMFQPAPSPGRSRGLAWRDVSLQCRASNDAGPSPQYTDAHSWFLGLEDPAHPPFPALKSGRSVLICLRGVQRRLRTGQRTSLLRLALRPLQSPARSIFDGHPADRSRFISCGGRSPPQQGTAFSREERQALGRRRDCCRWRVETPGAAGARVCLPFKRSSRRSGEISPSPRCLRARQCHPFPTAFSPTQRRPAAESSTPPRWSGIQRSAWISASPQGGVSTQARTHFDTILRQSARGPVDLISESPMPSGTLLGDQRLWR